MAWAPGHMQAHAAWGRGPRRFLTPHSPLWKHAESQENDGGGGGGGGLMKKQTGGGGGARHPCCDPLETAVASVRNIIRGGGA